MSWSETRQTLLDTLLARLGLVRQKHYDDLAGRYARLTSQYIHVKEMINKSVIADADKYEIVERGRRGGAL